jgi:hypothetical protein
MQWDKRIIQLRDALALLIPFPNNALMFLQDAGIQYGMINFEGGPLTMWTNILRYALNNKKVDDLVDIILDKFPGNPYLLAYKEELLQDYSFGPDIRKLSWNEVADSRTKEKIIGSVSTLLPIRFLTMGLTAAKAVGRITIPGNGYVEVGSGFLIKDNLLITNNHVIPDKSAAKRALIEFDYEESEKGLPVIPSPFTLDPESFFITNEKDDFTAVKIVGDANSSFGKLVLKNQQVKPGDFVNIIQHPGGRYKQIGLYHNVVTYADDYLVQYLTDTEPGSSGSPVFNSQWEVVALHHSGGMLQEPGIQKKMLRNEGIAIGRIIGGLN